MADNRTNIDDLYPGAKSYLVLTILFFILSALALALFYFIKKSQPQSPPVSISPTPTSVVDIPTKPEPSIEVIATISASPTVATTAMPTPAFKTYVDPQNIFSVTHRSDRTGYEDKEGSGMRYTFYRQDGSIAVHLGSEWSWVYPNRQFNTDFTVSGQPTFRYDIAQQTIIDLVYGDNKITIQCLHGDKDELKSECDDFISRFRLL